LSLAERNFGIDLRSQGAVNSGLFTSFESAKMPKRASDKPKSRFKHILAIIKKTDSEAGTSRLTFFWLIALKALVNRSFVAG